MGDLFDFFDEDSLFYIVEDNMDDATDLDGPDAKIPAALKQASDADLSNNDPGASSSSSNTTSNNKNNNDNKPDDRGSNKSNNTSGNQNDNNTDDEEDDYNDTTNDDQDHSNDSQDYGDDDNSSDDNDSESEDPDPNQKLRELEDSLFNQLSPQQKKVKIKELKELYDIAYQKCANLIDLLNSSDKAQNQVKICDFVINSLTDLQKCIREYLINIFDSKTYIQNMVEFNKYLSVLNTVSNVIAELNGDSNNDKKTKSSSRK